MSATTAADYTDRLNLAELVSRIEKQQAETRKYAEEATKLAAEAAKLRRDTNLAPWIVAGAVAGGVAALVTPLLRTLGVVP